MTSFSQIQPKIPTWQVHQDNLIQKLQEETRILNEKLNNTEKRLETFVSNTVDKKLSDTEELLEIKWKNKTTSTSSSIQHSLEV